MMSDKKKMKKSRKILLYIFITFFVLIAAFAWWQRANIQMIVDIMNSSGAEIQERVEKSNEEMEEVLGRYGLSAADVGVETTPANTDEPLETTIPAPSAEPSKTPATVKPEKPSAEDVKKDLSGEIVKKYAAQMQTLRGSYDARLESLWTEAENDFRASVPPEKRSPSTRAPFISKYVGRAYSLQNSCNNEVEKLLSNLERELSDIGADTAIVSTMREAYQSEKSAKMAYFMGKFD